MNYKMMGRLIALILLAEAAFMVPALIISSRSGQFRNHGLCGEHPSDICSGWSAFDFRKKGKKRLLCARGYGLRRFGMDCDEPSWLSSILDFT